MKTLWLVLRATFNENYTRSWKISIGHGEEARMQEVVCHDVKRGTLVSIHLPAWRERATLSQSCGKMRSLSRGNSPRVRAACARASSRAIFQVGQLRTQWADRFMPLRVLARFPCFPMIYGSSRIHSVFRPLQIYFPSYGLSRMVAVGVSVRALSYWIIEF